MSGEVLEDAGHAGYGRRWDFSTHAASLSVIMSLTGEGHTRALAGVREAPALVEEILLTFAICAHEFVRVHQMLARGKSAGREAENV